MDRVQEGFTAKLSKANKNRSSPLRHLRRFLVYYLYELILGLLQIIPEKCAYAILGFLASLAYITVGKQRRIALRNLQTGFPDLNNSERIHIAKEMYRQLSRNAVEFARFGKIRDSGRLNHFVEVTGREHLEKIASMGKGGLALTAHLGNWELLAAKFVNEGYKVTVLARKASYERYENLIERLRRISRVDAVDRDNIREILRRLQQGHFLGILSDHDIPKLDGVFVNFLDRPAYTPTGIVTLAMKTGLPVLPMFIIRKNDGRHRITVEPPLEMIVTGDKEQDILVNTRRYTEIIERYVREYPEQWMWFHNRWRTIPDNGFLHKETANS